MQKADFEIELLDEEGLIPIISNQINMNNTTLKIVFPNNLQEKEISEVKKIKIEKFIAKKNLIIPLINFFEKNNEFIKNEKDENLKKLQLAFMLTAYLSNCIKVEFSDFLVENTEKYDENIENDKILFCREIANLIPTCINAINFSTINFIRFNHHFPKEKKQLIKKAFINILDTYLKDIIPDNEEEEIDNQFYEKIVPLIKTINEYAFYNLYIKDKNIEKEENEIEIQKLNKVTVLSNEKAYNLRINQPIIMIRNNPTTNGFLILDLLELMIEDFKNKKFLPFIPYKKEIKELLELREELLKDPFANHPSRNYFKYEKNNFIENYKKLTINLEKLGNLIYLYCKDGSKSLKQAKSCLKYSEIDYPTNKNIMVIYNEAFNNLEFDVEEVKKYVKENLSNNDIMQIINEKKNIEEENEKYYEFIKSIKKEL